MPSAFLAFCLVGVAFPYVFRACFSQAVRFARVLWPALQTFNVFVSSWLRVNDFGLGDEDGTNVDKGVSIDGTFPEPEMFRLANVSTGGEVENAPLQESPVHGGGGGGGGGLPSTRAS